MTVIGRRIVPAVPPLSGVDLTKPQDVERFGELLRSLEDFLQVVRDALDEGAPVPHIVTHDLNSGADPIPTAIPANPTGPSAAIGSANSLIRSDCVVKQGIVTTKGDVLGYSTVPARVAVGADGKVLTADSVAAEGVSYKTVESVIDPANENVILAGHVFGRW